MSDDKTAQLIESLQKRYGLSFLGSEKAMRHFARGWVFLTSPQEPSQGEPLAWISVKHRLPTHHHSVLGFVVRGGMVAGRDDPMIDIVSYGGPSDPRWLQFIGDAGDAVVKVTHWMELPDRPDGGKA